MPLELHSLFSQGVQMCARGCAGGYLQWVLEDRQNQERHSSLFLPETHVKESIGVTYQQDDTNALTNVSEALRTKGYIGWIGVIRH